MTAQIKYGLTAAIMMALLCLAPMPAASQEASGTSAGTSAAHGEKKDAGASKPTPRLADGHPDLNGFWVSRAGADPPVGANFGPGQQDIVRDGDKVLVRFGEGGGGGDKSNIARRAANPNQPPYKPELLAKVKYLADNENKEDPAFLCKQGGVPRMGAPHAILQTPGMPIVFLYEVIAGDTFRIIPTDGRRHDPDADPAYMGDSVGHWEGDTLVVDTVNFNDDTWLGIDGWFHSTALHVTERITRQGDTFQYQATVEDPKVFTRPWVMEARTGRLTKQLIMEIAPCMDVDREHLVNKDHH